LRLDSWKEIAGYLNRHVTTVRRWEKFEGLPVHRHVHDKLGSVYAFRAELDAWALSRRERLELQLENTEPPIVVGRGAGFGWQPLRTRKVAFAGVLLAVTLPAVYAMFRAETPNGTSRSISSIAVRPLENLSRDPSQDYLAEGVTEALIGELARIRALRVTSRTSSEAFRGSRKSLPEIAQALGAEAVLQGSVLPLGNRVRVSVRLVDARTDTHLWARNYERVLGDVLTLQSELALAIGEQISVEVTADERVRIASGGTDNPAAVQEYLIGRYHMWRDTVADQERAIAHFARAAELDPAYARAYAGAAHAWWKLGLWGQRLPETELPARDAVKKALQLDPALPEALVVQADLLRLYDRDLQRAEELAKRALTLQPHSVDAHYTYAFVLMTLGRSPEAVKHMEAAAQLDPFSPAIQSDLGRVLYRARRYDDSLVHLHRALELEPGMHPVINRLLTRVYEQMGKYDRAISALERGDLDRYSYQVTRARLLARMGERREARSLLEGARANPARPDGSLTASAYVALGDFDTAFNMLFEDVEDDRAGPNFVAVDPLYDDLHSDPRWPELVRRINTVRVSQPLPGVG
jgi:TolB-like protein/tetratricopeptide (TPR) repeat protein